MKMEDLTETTEDLPHRSCFFSTPEDFRDMANPKNLSSEDALIEMWDLQFLGILTRLSVCFHLNFSLSSRHSLFSGLICVQNKQTESIKQ